MLDKVVVFITCKQYTTVCGSDKIEMQSAHPMFPYHFVFLCRPEDYMSKEVIKPEEKPVKQNHGNV